MNNQPEPTDFNSQVAANVRSLRTTFGLSQSEIADAMTQKGSAWQQQTVLKVEKGSRPLRFEEAIHLAAVLQVRLEQLVTWDRAAANMIERRRLSSDLRELEDRRSTIDHQVALAQQRLQELDSDLYEGEADGER